MPVSSHDRDWQARVERRDVAGIRRDDHVSSLPGDQRNVAIDDVGATNPSAQDADRARSWSIEYLDQHVRRCQQHRHSGLPRTAAPCLRDDTGGDHDGESLLHCGAQERSDPSVTPFHRDQGTSVQRESVRHCSSLARTASAQATSSALGGPNSRSH